MGLKPRNVYKIAMVVFAAVACLIPPELSTIAILCCAAVSAALGVFLFADWLLGKWLRRQIDKPINPAIFLLRQSGWILILIGSIVTCICSLIAMRIPVSPSVDSTLYQLTLIAIGIAGSGVAFEVLSKLTFHRKRPHPDILERLPEWPIQKQLAEARAFNRIASRRVFFPLSKLWLVSGLVQLAVFGAAAGAGWLYMWFSTEPIPYVDFENWPFVLKAVALFVVSVTAINLATSVLTTFRLVERVHNSGHLRRKDTARECGVALERAGLVGTVGWGLLLAGISLTIAFVGWSVFTALIEEGTAGVAAAASCGVSACVALFWFLVVWPQMYIPAVLTTRDCGWLRASEISTTILAIEGAASLKKLIIVTCWSVTIWRLPAAIHLLLRTTQHYDLVISAILNEKSAREVDQTLEEMAAKQPGGLKRAWAALEGGRYLDALNAFQLYQRNHREDIDSLRGESLAMLYIGNPGARERLERWGRLAPDDEEVVRLLSEFRAGLWAEDGAAYQDAQRRSRQEVGRGI